MTITISTNQRADISRDAAIAQVNAKGEVWLWPKGLGEGPIVIFDEHDWDAVVSAVAMARKSADGKGRAPALSGYTACEGVFTSEDSSY